MYLSILYNFIYIVVFLQATLQCLKNNKKNRNASKKVLKNSTPIAYETDPLVLEKERKRMIAENRAKMRKKREKQLKQEALKEASISKPIPKELSLLKEDSTQPTYSDESIDTSGELSVEKVDKKPNPPKPEERERRYTSSTSSEEELGDVQLVDQDPHATLKKQMVKKRAQEMARRKQVEEVINRRHQQREESSYILSPDDTLKNVSSIQFESQLSTIQRKRRDEKKTDGESITTESVIKEATLIEPKSNELYVRELTQKVLGGS